MSGIIFDSGTKSRLFEHLNIKIGSFFYTLCLQKLVFRFEIAYPLLQFFLDCFCCPFDHCTIHYVMGSREYCHMFQFSFDLTGQHINLRNPVDLVPEKFHPDCCIFLIGGDYFQHIPSDTECTTLKIHVISIILDLYQLADHLIPVFDHTRTQGDHHVLIVCRTTQTIDTGHAGHYDHIPPLCQRHGRRQTQLINLVIDRRILCDIGIG